MKRVFGYLRVSGNSQLDGDGFDRQKETIERFCESKGWIVARWFREEAVSGAVEAMSRPAFSEMLSLVGPATTDTIVVERSDRLARDLIVSEVLIAEAKKNQALIFEAAADLELTNSDDPTRVLIRQLMAALAEWEKNTTVKKLRVARERIRSVGKRCEGTLPLEESPGGLEIAATIIHLKEVRGLGYKRIADYLTKNKIFPLRSKKPWNRGTISDIYSRIKHKDYVRQFFKDSLHESETPVKQFCPDAADDLSKVFKLPE